MIKKLLIAMAVKEIVKVLDKITKPTVEPTATERRRPRNFTEPRRSSGGRYTDYDGYVRDHSDPL